MWHDPDRAQGLKDMRRPETVGEFQQFLQAVNWMRTALPGLAVKEVPLREMETCLRNTSRTKMVASRRIVSDEEWTEYRTTAWDEVKALVAKSVTLTHLKPGRQVLMFPDVSDLFWGNCVT